jgi:hypothetical protein
MKKTKNKSSSEPFKVENPIDAAVSSIKDKLINKLKVLSEKFKVLYESKFCYICVIGITIIAGIWSLFAINHNNDFPIGLSALLLLPSFYSLYIIYKEGISNHHWKIYYSFMSFFILVFLLVQFVFELFLFFLVALTLVWMAYGEARYGKVDHGINSLNRREREITKTCSSCNHSDTRKAKAWRNRGFSNISDCPMCGKKSMYEVF